MQKIVHDSLNIQDVNQISRIFTIILKNYTSILCVIELLCNMKFTPKLKKTDFGQNQ